MKIIKVAELVSSSNGFSPVNNFGGVYYFDTPLDYLQNIVLKEQAVLITDHNVFENHKLFFHNWKTIVIPAGEEHKQQSTVDYIINTLIELNADRQTFIVGIGGGVVTDITGYAASVYMRGLRFGFVPTTILAMVDAAIGGKNGVDVGIFKNLVGLIKQPEFLLFDYTLLKTLPHAQWVNGFAEVIKHASIKDAALFALLENETVEIFQDDNNKLAALIEKNVSIKTGVVINDEFEKGDRKLLNFGHTIGHAIENRYRLPHGHAVSIGMIAACALSESISHLAPGDTKRVKNLLERYHLPTNFIFDKEKILEVIQLDKKRAAGTMNFVLLNKIGEASVQPVSMNHLKSFIDTL